MLILTLIVVLSGAFFISKAFDDNAKDALSELHGAIMVSLDEMYPGDYSYSKDDEGYVHLYKGEHEFNGDTAYIDLLSKKTDCDITITYYEYPVITTITDDSGLRMTGYSINSEIANPVLMNNEYLFYDKASFNDEQYYIYYGPLLDEHGNAVGMLAVSRKAESIRKLIIKALIPVLVIAVLSSFIMCLFVYRYSNVLISLIRKIQSYMRSISEEDFRSELSPEVLKRGDELSEMGESAVKTASSLRHMVEEDQLTGLLNRRSAYKRFDETINNYTEKGVRFCVALGDIDFFKNFNDTYGHDVGDKVLATVSHVFREFMRGKGYAIRWGGEEFLLVFENIKISAAEEAMNSLLNEIRNLDIENEGESLKISMTFGLTECGLYDKKFDEYIKEADDRLYFGKENGRDRLVSSL